MLPENPEPEVVTSAPRPAGKLWVQILIVILLALLAQAIALGFAYLDRCKPGTGNDWCGMGSLGDALLGFVAALCILIAGMIVIVLRRRSRRGGGKVGGLRILAVALGVVVLLPCAWMLGFGWERNHADGGLWLGVAIGVGLIAAAFFRRRKP
jgi:hypothetical protein